MSINRLILRCSCNLAIKMSSEATLSVFAYTCKTLQCDSSIYFSLFAHLWLYYCIPSKLHIFIRVYKKPAAKGLLTFYDYHQVILYRTVLCMDKPSILHKNYFLSNLTGDAYFDRNDWINLINPFGPSGTFLNCWSWFCF